MRTKEEIMADAWDKCNCETLQDMQGGLIVELHCDMRDEQIAHNGRVEQILQGGSFMARRERK